MLPLLILWANIHGSVLIGAALATLAFAHQAVLGKTAGTGNKRVAYGALAIAVLLTPLATPYGFHIVDYYREMFGNHAVGVADIEWDPPAFPALSFFQFVIPLALAAGSVAMAVRKRYRPSPLLMLAVLGTAVSAGLAMHNNIWLGISAAILVGDTTRSWLRTRPPRRGFIVAIGLAAVVCGVVGVGRLVERQSSGYLAQTPVRAVHAATTYTATHPCARVIADDRSASALIWLDPTIAGRVAFDGELEVYPQQALMRWIDFQAVHGRDWMAAAAGYQVLIGTQADHPELVLHLRSQRGATILGGDASGIAVLSGRSTTRCARPFA